ncbi:MAG: hypothetical protein IPL10_01480 [Bacteroidetes bacterium]|jgi:hypothetical protein|nr:hypothetical protein [Bacteroidota bacterium]MBK8366103.1 hypothetical protein [Bacteroidota bacterium]
MRQSKLALVLILFIVNIISLSGQTAGYMGKRLVGGYGFYFSPALFGSNGQGNTIIGRSNGNASDGEFAFNSLHEGFLEYAFKNRFLLGISAKFYKTTYDNAREVSATTKQIDQYGSTSVVSYNGTPQGMYTILGQNYSLYAKLFNRRYLAPWGRYMQFGITIRRFTCHYNPNEMMLKYGGFNNYVYPDFNDFGEQKQSFTKFDFLFGFGRTNIVANRITIDYGFNANVFALLSTFFDVVTDGDGIFTNNVNGVNYMKSTSPWRVRGVNRFNVFLKVGVLLF